MQLVLQADWQLAWHSPHPISWVGIKVFFVTVSICFILASVISFHIYYNRTLFKNQAYPETRRHIFYNGGYMKSHKIQLKNVFDKVTLTDIFRMSLISVIISLAAVLIFGIIIKLVEVGNGVIMPVNQVIKVVSLLFGAIIGIREKRQGILKGAIAGLIYTVISVFVFLILGGQLKGSFGIVDALLGIVMGAVSAIIAVNTGKSRVKA